MYCEVHGAIDDVSLPKLNIPSSAVRKLFPIPVLREDSEHDRCIICVASVDVGCQTLQHTRSQLSSRGVDTKSPQKNGGVNYVFAESISRSRFWC